jgi:glyoxylase-like metal-dependent hydrolase (beta-lactamase superfamily II)
VPRSALVELAPGAYRIPLAPADSINSFVFTARDHTTLIDCGPKPTTKRLVRALEQLPEAPGAVSRIVLTHAHWDHAGGLARLRARTGAPVAAHERDTPYVRAGRHPASDPALLRSYLVRLIPMRFDPVDISEELVDGDVLPGGLRIVHTPGHTPGHVSLLHEPSGVLVAGDALFNLRGLSWPPAVFCTDFRLAQRSASVLADLEFEVIAFSHGPEIRNGSQDAVRSFLRSKGVTR